MPLWQSVANAALHGSVSHEITLAATPARVFGAFSELALRRQWFRLPSPGNDARHELDFRIGGGELMHGTVTAAGTAELIDYRSRFVDVVDDERLVYTSELRVDDRLRSVSVVVVELWPEAA